MVMLLIVNNIKYNDQGWDQRAKTKGNNAYIVDHIKKI